jgi:hypothetical protein
MSMQSTGLSDCETGAKPLVVGTRTARKLLGGIGANALWDMLRRNELDSYLDGRSRMRA